MHKMYFSCTEGQSESVNTENIQRKVSPLIFFLIQFHMPLALYVLVVLPDRTRKRQDSIPLTATAAILCFHRPGCCRYMAFALILLFLPSTALVAATCENIQPTCIRLDLQVAVF